MNGCIRNLGNSSKAYKHIKGAVIGPDEKAGHVLRGKFDFPFPAKSRSVKTLIIGGGISGLSAGRWLKKEGFDDFEILELEDHVGGNAHSRSNSVSAYPLGAHYITIANNDDQLLIDFLKEIGVITHFENELPCYNEFYLCFDPEERLLINGQWQEGLIPQFGIPEQDHLQIERFFKLSNLLKQSKGSDGKDAFTIPIDRSSADPVYRDLDKISFGDYLKQQGFTSKYLLWYLNYCCKDDYGQRIDKVSAWSGLNYFAGHKGKAANAEEGAVLTWPEGNAWLVKKLKDGLADHIKTSVLTYSVVPQQNGKVVVRAFDLKKKKCFEILADSVIMATPQYVNRRILKDVGRPEFNYDQLSYAPWMVANITIKDFTSTGSPGLCWDNVPYGQPSVGYVYSGHQQLDRNAGKVFTFYLPLCDQEPGIARLAAYSRSHEQWLDKIIPELEFMHPGITSSIENIEIWIWGHGMAVPSPGYLWGADREKAALPVNDRVFFAHTDLSGISLFEEGFHQGIRAAKELLAVKGEKQ